MSLEVQIVVAEGILDTDEARALAAAARRDGESLLTRLHAQGRISPPTFASLRARVDELARARDALARGATTVPGGGGVRPPPDDDAFPVPGWDRYEPIRLLGQGGMGRVFLARDLRLDRDVAIKFVRGDDPELARRIVAEARAQARVTDDRVCKVYEVGEVRGRTYIAMQAIAGRPLSELADALTCEQKAMVVRGAALGVHEAHRVGLIHRDLKPSNIMVERTAADELRPFVMDFGIARDWATDATATGSVLGTPQFMAPEQARGEVKRLDRRADVYSLGATLYALLTGRPPLDGDNPLVVLNRIAVDEPTRPRALDPSIPVDLEAITLKCLEKEPSARYDSARALADDLGRFLDGAPVAARAAAGAGYRLRKQLHRHRRLVAAALVVVAVIAVAIGYGVRERRRAAEREVLARRFTERVERIEALARSSVLAPAHDVRADRALIQAEMDAIGAALRSSGDVGAGHYALGRGHLALGDLDRAEAELDLAWQRGFRDPRAAYAWALALGRLYERGLHDAERVGGAASDALRAELRARYRDPALALLRRSEGPGLPPADYVAALIAFHEERAGDALAHLDAIDLGAGGMAGFYEAPLLRAQVLRGRAAVATGDGAAARSAADLDGGRRALAQAAAIAESDPDVAVEIAELESTAFAIASYSGGQVDGPFTRGVEAAGRALALLPDHAGALAVRSRLRRAMADYRARRGEDVTALLTGALDDAERASALAPDRAGVAVAAVHRQWGELQYAQGHDPTAQLDAALAALATLPPARRTAIAELERGLAHTVWADFLDDHGADAAGHRGDAIAAYRAALARDPALREAWLDLGSTYLRRAEYGAASADDDLAEARAALDRGQALAPDSFAAYLYGAEVEVLIAQRAATRGADPGPARARAAALYRTAIAKNPHEPQLHSELSALLVEQAHDAAAAGRDPTALFDGAEATATEAIRIAPDSVYGHNNLGDAKLQRALWLLGRADPRADPAGPGPGPLAAAAVAAFTDALARLPDHATILANLAMAHGVIAADALAHHRDARAPLAAAHAALDRARAADAADPMVTTAATWLADVEARR